MATDEIPESWQAALGPVLATPQARQLGGFLVEEERAGKPVYPPRGCRLAALELTLSDDEMARIERLDVGERIANPDFAPKWDA